MDTNFNYDKLKKLNLKTNEKKFFDAKIREVKKLSKKNDNIWVSKTHEGKLYDINCDTLRDIINNANQNKNLLIQTLQARCSSCEFNVVKRGRPVQEVVSKFCENYKIGSNGKNIVFK